MIAAGFDQSSRRVLALTAAGQLLTYHCTICGGLDQLLPIARTRLALTGRKLSDAERKSFGG
jgi:hypothetical protein